MQDVQKLPKSTQVMGTLQKKKGNKKASVGWTSNCTHLCVWVESKQNPPERPAESFSDLSCMIQLINQHPAFNVRMSYLALLSSLLNRISGTP